jgi:hypothetical protein
VRGAAIPGALAMASLTVSVGCGAQQPSAQLADSGEESARFTDVTFYVAEGEKRNEVIEGAFDWGTSEGWYEGRYGDGPIGFELQVGADCFQRGAGEDWKHWRAAGETPLCSDVFLPPPELLADLRSYGSLESLGEEEVAGVKTTHYRVVPSEADSDHPEQWLEVWLDRAEVIYKLNRPEGEASPRTRDYFDFGVDVHVTPPCRPMPAHPSTTLTREKGKPPCVEETE